jgi:ethanolamine utilization protein EutQ
MSFDRATLERIVREAVKAELAVGAVPLTPGQIGKQSDQSGVITADPAKAVLEPFPFPIESDRVQLVDLLTLAESPRLGCGVMAMEETSFAWTLEYDEVDYVIEGTLDIVVDGRPIRARAGQVLFIPKGTAIRFSTPDRCRFLYVCYPANWADQ